MRILATILFLSVPSLLWAQTTDEDILRALAAQNNRVGIAAYLKARHPQFHDAAAKAGLATWLDGAIDFATFRSRVSGHGAEMDMLSRSVGSLSPSGGVKVADVYAAGGMNDPVKMAELLRPTFYDAERHPLARILADKWWGSVGVEPGRGQIAWFNPYLDVPELGIRRGEPLTSAQQQALVRLFGVKTNGTDAPGTVGRAFFPEDVGRAINANPGVITLLSRDGALIRETTSKGAGPTRTSKGDGLLDLSEALLDAEVSRNLQKAGGRIYAPVMVIDIGNGKAIYVRASQSLLRESHMGKYSTAETEKLFDYVLNGGRATPDQLGRLKTWVQQGHARTVGYNAGLLSGMGMEHPSMGSGNYGLYGELVDWGGAAGSAGGPDLVDRGYDGQKDSQLKFVAEGVETLNAVLARAEITAADRPALEALAKANGVGFAAGESNESLASRIQKRLDGSKPLLEGVDRPTLDAIAKGHSVYINSSDGDAELNKKIVDKIKGSYNAIDDLKVDRPTLETIARANGVEIVAGEPDADLNKRIIEEVRQWESKKGLEGLRHQADIDHARRNFWDAVIEGKAVGMKHNLTFVESYISQADDTALRNLAKRFGGTSSTSRSEALDLLKQNGLIDANADIKPIESPQVYDRARARARMEATAAGHFAAAFLVKEAFKAIETGDPEAMKHALREVGTLRFWGDLAVFTLASRAVEHLPLPGFARMGLPLAAGMAAVQLLHGQASLRDVLIDTAAFMAAGWAVGLVADGLIYPALFAAGPPGWIAAGVYTVAKLAVTLYGGEKLGAWIRGMFDRGSHDAADQVRREGVKQKLDALHK